MAVRNRLLLATSELMRRRGVAGTAVSDVLAESGVARRSIYLNFPHGKSELVTEATRASGELMTKTFEAVLQSADPLQSFVEMWRKVLTSTNFDAGCPIVAAALARSDAPEASDVAGEVFHAWQHRLVESLVDRNVDPAMAESLAITILSAIEGAVVIAQAQQSTRPIDEIGARLADLINLHTHTDAVR